MNKRPLSTYDEYVQSLSKKDRKRFEEGYQEFLLSELIVAIMKEDEISIRKLAQEAKISPTVVQDMRSGKKNNFTMRTFLKILEALGYLLIVEKQSESSRRFVVSMPS